MAHLSPRRAGPDDGCSSTERTAHEEDFRKHRNSIRRSILAAEMHRRSRRAAGKILLQFCLRLPSLFGIRGRRQHALLLLSHNFTFGPRPAALLLNPAQSSQFPRDRVLCALSASRSINGGVGFFELYRWPSLRRPVCHHRQLRISSIDVPCRHCRRLTAAAWRDYN